MSKEYKLQKLQEINNILERCKENSNIRTVLMKEKRRLEHRLSCEDGQHRNRNKSAIEESSQDNQHLYYKKEDRKEDKEYKHTESHHQNNKTSKGNGTHSNAEQSTYKKKAGKSKSLDFFRESKKKKERMENKKERSNEATAVSNSSVNRRNEKSSEAKRSNKHYKKESSKDYFNVKEKQRTTSKPNKESGSQEQVRSHRQDKRPNKDDGKVPKAPLRNVKSLSNNRETSEGSKSIKTFTSDEIYQMSSHGRKKLPSYNDPPHYAGKSSRSDDKVIMWKPHKHRKPDTDTADSSSSAKKEVKKAENASKSRSPRRMTSKLMRLREDDVDGEKALPLSDKRRERLAKSPDSNRAHSTKTRATNQRTANHKTLRLQSSAPAKASTSAVNSTKKTQYLDIGQSSSSTSGSLRNSENEVKLKDGTKLLQGEVVFKIDLDEITKKQPEKKSLTSFFRRKVFRVKNSQVHMTTQTEANTYHNATQLHQWQIPGFLHNQESQTVSEKSSSATQTMSTSTEAQTQTKGTRTKHTAIQSTVTQQNAQTQTLPVTCDGQTQTEEEDHEVWDGGVSLDRLVRCRERRKARSTIRRSGEHEKKSTFDQFKRSATLPHGREKQDTQTNQAITSFSWSQTEKFVKVIISHSGVHLVPASNIAVKTNGLNLKLTIEKDSKPEKENSNKNNSNNRTSPAGPFYELLIPQLCHPVASISYTVQADMLTILLRKREARKWEDLASQANHNNKVYL